MPLERWVAVFALVAPEVVAAAAAVLFVVILLRVVLLICGAVEAPPTVASTLQSYYQKREWVNASDYFACQTGANEGDIVIVDGREVMHEVMRSVSGHRWQPSQ